MHIAQFVHRYPPALGGAEAYTARLCNHLANCGDNVHVWTSTAIELEDMWRGRKPSHHTNEDVETRTLREPSVRVTRYEPVSFPTRRYTLKALSLLPIRTWQCLTSPCNPLCPAMWRDAGRTAEPVDAVHATAFPYSFPIACGLRLARRHGVPFFLTPFLHLGDWSDPNDRTRRQYTRPHLRWLLSQADGVFAQTKLERDAVIGMGVEANRVHLQGLGVDAAECTGGGREKCRTHWGTGPNEVVIGHLANNSVEKGTCDLLQAAATLWEQGKRFRVILAGPQMPNFLEFWDKYPYKVNVTRLGVLKDDRKRDFFAGIDAFALPSFTDSFGLVLLEAWANGKPNLVYRAGGPGELVRDGIDGLQARCGDVSGLSSKLRLLIENDGLRRKLGATGQGRISLEFQWDDKLRIVRDVLTGRAGSSTLPGASKTTPRRPRVTARAG